MKELDNKNIYNTFSRAAPRMFVLGFWLVLLPGYFIFCALMKYYFTDNTPFLDIVDEFWTGINKNFYFRFIIPVLLVGGPAAAFCINLIALIKPKSLKEIPEIKKSGFYLFRPNTFICVVSFLIIVVFALYGIKKFL